MNLKGMPLQQAVDAIHVHHDGVDVRITVSPERLPPAVSDESLRVVAHQYTHALDDVGIQHFWSLELGTFVPDVAGLDFGGATETLEAHGFKVVPTPTEAAADWLATGSDPAAGQLVAFGEAITVTLTPPDSGQAVVPDLIGETESGAEDLLDAAGLVIDVEFVDVTGETDVGLVVRQSPPPDTSADQGDTVRVFIGQSTIPGQVVVPDLIGETESGAEDLLDAAGLVIEVEAVEVTDDSDVGLVVQQSPTPDTRVDSGDMVRVFVGQLAAGESGGSGAPWLLAGLGALLALGLVISTAVLRARARRQRLWVQKHVSSKAHAGTSQCGVDQVPGTSPSSAVRLVPHSDSGSQQLTGVGAP